MRGLQLAKQIGLTLDRCKTAFEPINCDGSLQSVEALIKDKFGARDASMIIWQIHKLSWCRVLDGRIDSTEELNVDHWLEFRVFNADEEIHAKRSTNGFNGRYAVDGRGADNDFVDSFSRLWGEKVSASDGCVRLKDAQRKLEMNVPVDDDSAAWYGLLTRNYVGSDKASGLSGYVDYRFVAIEPAEGGADIG